MLLLRKGRNGRGSQEDGRNKKEWNEKGIMFPERTLGIAGTSKRNPAKKERNGTECRNSPEYGVQNCRNQKGMHNLA